MSIKVTFSPFFTITGFKKFHTLFFTYQESIWRFWFSSNYHELCLRLPCVWLTVKENDRKWSVFGATCFKLKFGRLQTDVLSPGLHIHAYDCRSRDRCIDLLKVPKISSRGSSSDSQKQFFVARILQELFGRVVLKFNHFELKNITFNQNILFSNAVLDLDPVYMEWGTPV